MSFMRRIFSRVTSARMSTTTAPYSLEPLKLGAVARGLNLKDNVSPEVIAQIKQDVTKHHILIFKDQGVISGDRHVEISQWFGELESTFYKHPKSPHPDVFRVSNDKTEGCTGVGRTGWHIDGSFQPAPFAYALYHMVSVPQNGGNTVFVNLSALIESLGKERRKRWERLRMISDSRDSAHPIIYSHPITKSKTLCFHLGMTEAFIWDKGTQQERYTNLKETGEILDEIYREIVKNDGELIYSHKWEVGDFIMSDNLSVGHEASPSTQHHRNSIGLRVLHRTTVKGIHSPTKEYDPDTED
ncbi:PREDICTED: pentalenolactone F synthase-like isoform X2 [Priapulus caudatus]|uniref:Pentalenolactone F synthase-like isoform X2 n=1 Tax=Priapulus caudatus TaxID=37621 RepID=A0ABM1DZE0_PRICU|nr:PREDICTED: pentalenolactone F synthase-like isoform X2 [Priapulus caudatus]